MPLRGLQSSSRPSRSPRTGQGGTPPTQGMPYRPPNTTTPLGSPPGARQPGSRGSVGSVGASPLRPGSASAWPAGETCQMKEVYTNDAIEYGALVTLRRGERAQVVKQFFINNVGWLEIKLTQRKNEMVQLRWARKVICVWPEDWPFITIRDYLPTASATHRIPDNNSHAEAPQLQLRKDDRGVITRCHPERTWYMVQVQRGSERLQGSVPGWAIKPGDGNAWGIVTLHGGIPEAPDPVFKAASFNVTGVFQKSVVGMIEAYRNNSNIVCPEHSVETMLGTLSTRQAAYRAIVEGTKNAGVLDVFEMPNFTVNDILRSGRQIRQGVNCDGIYIRVYRDFKEKYKGQPPRIYTGQSADMWSRDLGHNQAVNNPDYSHSRGHYDPARDAGRYDMVAICLLHNASYKNLAEQIFVDLLRTYLPYLTVLTSEALKTNYSSVNAAMEEETRELARKEIPAITTALANQVFQETGWPGGTSRATFGAAQGLNYQAPITEDDRLDKVLYVKRSFDQPPMDVYRRAPVIVTDNDPNGRGILSIRRQTSTGRDTAAWVLNLPEEGPGPQKGETVFVAFEVYRTGSHPKPYAAIPTVGPFADWADARRLGIKLEWVSPNDPMRYRQMCYVEAPRHSGGDSLALKSVDQPGALRNYNNATIVVRFLEQTPLSNPYSWQRDVGKARVKSLNLDYMSQTMNVVQLDPKPPVDRPRQLSFFEMRTKLWSAGAGQENPNRPKCDRCFLHKCPCQKTRIPQCRSCQEFGLPCTYTNTNVIMQSRSLRDALCPPPSFDGAVHLVDDFQVVGARIG